MKTQSPLARLNKPRQRRKLERDVQTFLRNGGQIENLSSTSAQGLCPVSTFDLYQKLGLYREL